MKNVVIVAMQIGQRERNGENWSDEALSDGNLMSGNLK
jgi:hypothetical protein